MDEKIGKLIEVLEKEVDLYEDFLHLLQVERQCMTDLSLDRLQECSKRKEITLAGLLRLEESRNGIISLIQSDYPSDRVTLSRIIHIVPTRYSKVLKACCSNLISLVNSIRETNQINGILAERMISYTRPSLSFLNRLALDMQVHRSAGGMQQDKKKGRLICRKR